MASIKTRIERVEQAAFKTSGPTPAQIAIAAQDFDARIARLRQRLLADIESDGIEAVSASVERDGSVAQRMVLAEILAD